MSPDAPESFAIRLRRLREGAALSQEALAERAGISAKAVGALERGERRRPYPSTIRALADALGLDDAGRDSLVASIPLRSSVDPPTAEPPGSNQAGAPILTPPTPLIGRERERHELHALLTPPGPRLVSLTGPGGVGKTRLAWDVVADLQREGHVVVPVELAPVRASELVLPTIARALGVRAGGDHLLTVVAGVVGDAERLLVLDNVEHVLDAAPDIADLLARCPRLRALATSRAPLRIRAEQEYPVRPLELPVGDHRDAVLASPAGRLFVDRARAVAPRLVLDDDGWASIAAICERLDGLPLAIELAAAHARYVAPSQLVARLDRALEGAGARDLPDRQRTMRATLEWSLELCTDDERHLLEVLSVFAGGFDRSAVESVAEGVVSDPDRALDGLIEQSLVSMVDAGPDDEARYRLLEPIRGFAASQLAPAEVEMAASRHADHYATVTTSARSGLRSADQQRWLEVLACEHANLAAALRTFLAIGRTDAAARMIGAIWPYWALRGHANEGLRWIELVLGSSGFAGLDSRARAAGMIASSGLRLATGDTPTVARHADLAALAARQASDDRQLGEALVLLASSALFEGDEQRAATAIAELAAVVVDVDDAWLRAHALTARAQRSIVRGELDESRGVLAEAEALARSRAGPFTLATVLNVGATLAMLDGADHEVLDQLSEAAMIAAEVGTTWTLVYTLPGLAGLALRRGDIVLAATLFAAAAATAERSMLTISFGPDAEAAAAQLDEVRQRLDPAAFEEAWAAGRDLGPWDVVELIRPLSPDGRP